MKKINLRIIFVCFLVFIIFLIIYLIILRFSLERQVDDVSPGIQCNEDILKKVEVLMVIPLLNNISIVENKSWCNYILALNKTLGMHGVCHTYNEFYETRNKDYILLGAIEFEKCFGFYPKIFEAPQLALSKENKRTLESMNFNVFDYGYNAFHKVYHCGDTGLVSNSFIDWI